MPMQIIVLAFLCPQSVHNMVAKDDERILTEPRVLQPKTSYSESAVCHCPFAPTKSKCCTFPGRQQREFPSSNGRSGK